MWTFALNHFVIFAVSKVSEHAGEKAGDKKNKGKTVETPSIPSSSLIPSIETTESKPLTDYEINTRVHQLLSGGKIPKMKFM